MFSSERERERERKIEREIEREREGGGSVQQEQWFAFLVWLKVALPLFYLALP